MIWTINQNGSMSDENSQLIGIFQPDGKIYDQRYALISGRLGPLIGSVEISGDVYNSSGVYLGFSDFSGIIYNRARVKIAQVDQHGNVSSRLGVKLGKIDWSLFHGTKNPEWCPMVYRAAAGAIFLFFEPTFR